MKMETLYKDLKTLEKKIKDENKHKITKIYQKDFVDGTYIIENGGIYKVMEDIVFNPNPDNDYLPKPSQEKYKGLGYSLGFFTMISIKCENVILDLNGKSLSVSKEFVIQQRFFSCIELADAPFPMGTGPGNFGQLTPARNVIIKNGFLRRSSHHGIHGNMNNNVLIENLLITDFEFIGIALNGASNTYLKDVVVKKNRKSPLLSTYSAARFAKMFANILLTKYSRFLNDTQISILTNKRDDLQKVMDVAFNEILSTGKTSVSLFNNESGIPDGNVYGVLIKNPGIAINDFSSAQDVGVTRTENIYLENVEVKDLRCKVEEVIAISAKGGKGAQTDVAGAVFRIDKLTDANGKYKGDELSELQLYLSQVSAEIKYPLGKNSISMDVVSWCKHDLNIKTLMGKSQYKFKLGSDSMQHLNKGLLMFRFDGLINLKMKNCKVKRGKNYGLLGNDVVAGHYLRSSDAAKRDGYFGAWTTGINLAYCENVSIENTEIKYLASKNGTVVGINIIYDSSNVKLKDVTLEYFRAGTKKRMGETYYHAFVKFSDTMPNSIPKAIPIFGPHRECNIYICDMKDCSKLSRLNVK